MKNSELIEEFLTNQDIRRGHHFTSSLAVEGDRLYSYSVILLYRGKKHIYFNASNFTTTITKHQQLVRDYCEEHKVDVIKVTNTQMNDLISGLQRE